ncbi:phage holin family protein [Micromonospora polyrhachis]|uniref:ABC-type multidrug transport system fused ATPase/permease subunit n=1 Tax=Micromonospora polyrhachis TaxID=1282883 RepID=A0A7W7SW12_9ACTN|nr:phage holin family protein [Micromonospora polyrhachis]MBB4962020.1 ABC-type multidrug transport system fused ATPase/permease subunit [Micromonospora polyrhachis]
MSDPARPVVEPGQDRSQLSLGELLGEVTRDVSTLVRQEVELAKAELRQDARTAGKAGGMFGGVALAGFMVLLFVSYAIWWALAEAIPEGWAALIVAVIWAVVAAVLFAMARKRMKEVRGLQRTKETVREMPTALRGR